LKPLRLIVADVDLAGCVHTPVSLSRTTNSLAVSGFLPVNSLKRCRDHTEIGFERYLALAVLGRNLHTLGRLLIAQQTPKSLAAQSRRKAA
jgi:hypothetical protein